MQLILFFTAGIPGIGAQTARLYLMLMIFDNDISSTCRNCNVALLYNDFDNIPGCN